ncbi:pectate lyase [Niveispirillum sp. KHB5.9]|uniref:pectate lyase n=1 Tax=Niveispirillum sp. KHB5.9 TaxID=3400269 RepID=UPI003A870EE7
MPFAAFKRALICACLPLVLSLPTQAQTATAAAPAAQEAAQAPSRDTILATMKRASRFMVEEAAVNGGFVWQYLPDFSRRWGELEASPTMIWVQPPGTPTMGNLFLDAWHATGDAWYLDAAMKTATALIKGQLESGGWNYVIDTAGPEAEQRWYATYGKNAWRMEEFHHYYGNGTFDDAGTAEATQFLLRLYLEKKDKGIRKALDNALGFILKAQYPNGGWPQRFPLVKDGGVHGRPDYTGYITFNDDVAGENLEVLVFAYQTLGDKKLLDPIRRGMDIFLATQQPQPQPAWGLQHRTTDLKPAGARTYEPEGFATHTTANNIKQLLNFYRLTGDAKYLARVPDALDWLDKVQSPANLRSQGRTHPTFITIGEGKPLYLHRRGSNVVNGEYYTSDSPNEIIAHYGSFRSINTEALRKEYKELAATAGEAVSKGSPLLAKPGTYALPRYFTLRDVDVFDMMKKDGAEKVADGGKLAELVGGLNNRGYWPVMLTTISNPYIGDGPATPVGGEYRATRVGDTSDTSPYTTDTPVEGISTAAYVKNMGELIKALGK